MQNTLQIACVSDRGTADPPWVWLKDKLNYKRALNWHFFQPSLTGPLDRFLGYPLLGRLLVGLRLRAALRRGEIDLIVSHFPHCTAWMALLIGEAKGKAFHLAFAFNFTNLPVGLKRLQMKRAFKRIDRFIVFTDMERKLYSEYFAISVEKFERILLGMARPIDLPGPRSVETPYVVSMGGEARDYPTLVETARLMKDTIFVLIVRPASLSDLELPSNIQVFTNIPWDDAWSLVYHAALAVIPLRNATTPNGHTTLVCGMHLGKAHVVTESSGLAEYVIHNQTAFTVPKGDVVAMQKAINLLLSDIDLAARLGDAAKLFAKNKCSEQTTLDFFSGFLDRFFRKDCVARLKKSDAQTV